MDGANQTKAEAAQDERYARAVAGFAGALERLSRAYEADPDARLDLLQDIHFALWRSFARFDGLCSEATWIYRVAHNAATSHVLKRVRLRRQTLVTLDELATYRHHGTHAEAIEIIFDPSTISYRDLLEFFFQIHDPSTKNRQGNDVGASYRSAIFYTSDEQKRIAEDTIADVDASGLWPGPVVTEVTSAGPFWEAEPEHQDYLERIPWGYTCHYVRPDWKLPRREQAVAG